jgi:hypothetical protein
MKVESDRRRVCWPEGHLPRFGVGSIPVGCCTREGAVCSLGFTDVGLVVEERGVLTVVDLFQQSGGEKANAEGNGHT